MNDTVMTRHPWETNGQAPRARGDALVEAELHRRIHAQGPITFAEFMALALYLLDGGYYEGHVRLGREGDFLTSPETHPLFGALLARLACRQWQTLGRPDTFHVIEYGAGSGALCQDIITAAPQINAAFARALRYVIIEASAYLRAEQQARLLNAIETVSWVLPTQETRYPAGCVLANEVVDALPVHRVHMEEEGLRELYVGLTGDRYDELSGDLSTPEIASYFTRVGVTLPVGTVAEVCVQAREWLQAAAARVARGYLVTIDHGGTAEDLYAKPAPRGQLKCFYRHAWTDDPFDRPGLQDITAPVDFTNLIRVGEEIGLEVGAYLNQREALGAWGIGAAGEEIEARPLPVQERQRNLQALQTLVDPQGLGRFRVLMQQKDAPACQFRPEDMEADIYIPLLPPLREEW